MILLPPLLKSLGVGGEHSPSAPAGEALVLTHLFLDTCEKPHVFNYCRGWGKHSHSPTPLGNYEINEFLMIL